MHTYKEFGRVDTRYSLIQMSASQLQIIRLGDLKPYLDSDPWISVVALSIT